MLHSHLWKLNNYRSLIILVFLPEIGKITSETCVTLWDWTWKISGWLRSKFFIYELFQFSFSLHPPSTYLVYSRSNFRKKQTDRNRSGHDWLMLIYSYLLFKVTRSVFLCRLSEIFLSLLVIFPPQILYV